MLMSAPAFSRDAATWSCPLRIAHIKLVFPSDYNFNIEKHNQLMKQPIFTKQWCCGRQTHLRHCIDISTSGKKHVHNPHPAMLS